MTSRGFTLPATMVQLVFLLGLIALGLGIFYRHQLPYFDLAHPETLREPSQAISTKKPFKVTVNAIEYTVNPLADYDIAGVVVSRYDTSSWWGFLHREMMDHLNVADLCVVWGANLQSNNYRQLRYSSGHFTCNAGTNSDLVWSSFNQDSLSNNHVLTDDPALRKLLRDARPGDQIRMKGVLSEYSHKQG